MGPSIDTNSSASGFGPPLPRPPKTLAKKARFARPEMTAAMAPATDEIRMSRL